MRIKEDIGADLELFMYIFYQSLFIKKIREEKKKWDVVKIFKNKKTFAKYELQISTKLTFDSGIETTIIIYQIEAHIKLHYMIWSNVR